MAKKQQQAANVRNINDLMSVLDSEIAAIKDGTLSEPKARIVAKNRTMQLQSFELMLQAARIEARFRNELSRMMGLPAPEKTITSLPQ